MSNGSLWERIRKARLVQVLIGYLAASWIVLQLIDTLGGTFELPEWIGPVTLILLVVGFIIVTATAWVQSHPLTERLERRDMVPSSWEVAPGEIKESLSAGKLPHLTWARALLGGVVAFSVMFGLAGLYVVIKDRGESFAPTELVASDDAVPGIAVLPFSVSGSDLDEWREGMVHMLSTNLDGAAGLRAINSRTVLARWDEEIGDDDRADEAVSLAIARESGGRYALLGSAVAIGSSVRLTADVYDVGTGESLGYSQVEGSPDDVMALVDQLSIQVIEAIVQTGQVELPSLNLASITTSSVEALKAFLEAEALYRESDFTGATEAYERAVAADSTFALAYHRLASTYGWSNYQGHPLSVQSAERAAELIDRLPARAALYVRIDATGGTYEGVELAEDAVRKYPDDAEAWYLLGETYYHETNLSLASWEDADEAFARAVELDPQFAPYRIHRTDLAFSVYDSTLAAERVEAYGRVAQDHNYRQGQLYLALAYGDSASRAEATVELGEMSDLRMRTMASSVREDARLWPMTEIMLDELKGRDQLLPLVAGRRIDLPMAHGKLGQYLDRLEREAGVFAGWQQCSTWSFASWEVPVPEDELARIMSPDAMDAPNAFPAYCIALYAIDKGDSRLLDGALGSLEAREAAARESENTGQAEFVARLSEAVHGYSLWKQGDLEEARSLLESSLRNGSFYWPTLIGDLHVERGDFEEAVRYYRSVWTEPMTRLKLARAYEQSGESEKARAAYGYFVSAWAEADPELQPMVEDAKQAIVRLMDAPGGS
jgi:tetratricopeptide (TPR) repeat protein